MHACSTLVSAPCVLAACWSEQHVRWQHVGQSSMCACSMLVKAACVLAACQSEQHACLQQAVLHMRSTPVQASDTHGLGINNGKWVRACKPVQYDGAWVP